MTPLRDALSGSGRVFLLIAACYLAAGFLRINDLSLYTPDSPRYVIWGNSLALGNGYLDDTQPDRLAFVFHAPLYPALIAPVEAAFPLSIEPVKIVTLLWGLTALCLFYFWLHRLLGRAAALAGAAILAFNPLYVVYSTEALSEVPFIAFVLVVLLILTGLEKGVSPGRAGWWILIGASACLGLLREVGVFFWLLACAYLFGRERKRGLLMLAAGVLALGGWYLRNAALVGAPPGSPGGNAGLVSQHFLTDPDGPFLAELYARLSLNLSSYLPAAAGMSFFPLSGPDDRSLLPQGYGFSDGLQVAVVALSAVGLSAGMIRCVAAGRGGRYLVISWLALLGAAAVYPVHDTRFLMPVFPLSVFFGLNGILAGVAALGGGKNVAAAAALAAGLAVVVPNLHPLAGLIELNTEYRADPATLRERLTRDEEYPYYYTQPWGRLKILIDGLPDSGTVIGTPAKELALVAGGRKVLEIDPGVTQTVFDRLLRVNGVVYLLAPVRWGDFRVYEFHMAESRRFSFDEVFSSGNLHLMKVTPRPFTREDIRTEELPSRAGAVDYLRRARVRIRKGDCAGALDDLKAASGIAPTRPEISYQAMVASAIIGDTVRARDEFRRLMGMRQVGSYLYSARYHLYLMGLLRSGRALPAGQERVFNIYDLGRRYWDHGYYRMARNLLTEGMMPDSSFFVGHLWAFHCNFQMGDTATARVFLGRLGAIDSSNSLVRNFHTLMDLRRLVAGLAPSPERALLRLRMARIYRDIELPDESSDEAEAALADDPGLGEALLFLAGTYTDGGYPRRALGFYRRYLGLAPGDTRAAAAADSLAVVLGGRR